MIIFCSLEISHGDAWTQAPEHYFIAIEQVETKASTEEDTLHRNYRSKVRSKNYFNIYNEYGLSNSLSLGAEINITSNLKENKNLQNATLSSILEPVIPYSKYKILSPLSFTDITKLTPFIKYNIFQNSNTSITLKGFLQISNDNWRLYNDFQNFRLEKEHNFTYGITTSFGQSFNLFNNTHFIDFEFGYKNHFPIINISYGFKDIKKMYIFKYIHQNDSLFNHNHYKETLEQNGIYFSQIQYKTNAPKVVNSVFMINKTIRSSKISNFEKKRIKEIGFSTGIWINS